MKTSQPVPVFVGLAVAGLLLSACGGGSSGDSGTKPLAEQQPNTEAAAASAPAASAAEGAASAVLASAAASAPQSAGSASPASSPSTATAAAPPQGTPAISSKSATTADTARATTAVATTAAVPTTLPAPTESLGVQAPTARIAAATDTTASSTGTAQRCVIDQTRYFGGSCWANVKDSIPSGTNRSYANVRLNHTGSVNANCINGKVYWSTGLCRPNTAGAASASLTAASAARPASSAYKIGTFYFPGWRDNQVGAPAKLPWARIKAYPEREPMLGWYDDGSVDVMEQQLKWMRAYGIDYVVFDWYWNGKDTELNHSVNAYFKTETRKDVPFALLWSNHTSIPRTKQEFTSMVDYWIKHYFGKPEFMKIDDKPVIFIFSHPHFVKQAAQTGLTYTALLNEAETRARQAGYKGIYFVGGTHVDASIVKVATSSGYSALSGYNYHGRDEDSSTSYEELDSAYRHVWNAILKDSSIPYILPMTQGWDKRPWGGSQNPLHDLSGGTPPEFERHLAEARRLMDAYPVKTMKMGVICCWNEFGEGSFIEPTKRDGFGYLEKVQKVFGSP